MEFKNRSSAGVEPEVLAQSPKTRFSIRLSILSIVMILLVGVSVLIIGVNYFTIDSLLVISAKNSLAQTSGKIAEQIGSYLKPLNTNILTAHRLIKLGVVKPQDPGFVKFLYSLIADNENLIGAYWGDNHGNIYLVNKEKSGFFVETILRDHHGIVTQGDTQYLDFQGNLLTTGQLADTTLDPRLRPWYQAALRQKSLAWTVYRFAPIGNQPSQPGITSVLPVYDAEGNSQGVVGIDMLLGTIDDYVENIKLTNNSFIFVMNLNTGQVIAAHTEKKELLALESVPNISDIKIPWLKEAVAIYKQKYIGTFVYTIKGEDYIASYGNIPEVKSDNGQWVVAIITPVNDIIAPLLKSALISTVLTVLTLLVGMILASFFSTSLSRPIRVLARDADLICQLQLGNIKQLFSRIKEVDDMAKAFIKMRNALYSFQRYMPIALVKKLILSNKIAEVGGEAKELTLLFSDIKNFTSLSEKFDPEKLMQYLSEYFQCLTKVIAENHGTVDKYVGDGVVAFWGAPVDDAEHALHACQAVIQARTALEKLNLKWRNENKPEVITRFGVSSGKVVIGNVGSADRLSYTSLGDPVNLASRLEGLNKVYGTTIMVSEFVYEKLKDQFCFRLLDRVAVKGKTQGVYVYELIGELSCYDLKWRDYNCKFAEAFADYEKGYWESALHLFRQLSEKYPEDQVAQVFISRAASFIDNPPRGWSGIWIMDEK